MRRQLAYAVHRVTTNNNCLIMHSYRRVCNKSCASIYLIIRFFTNLYSRFYLKWMFIFSWISLAFIQDTLLFKTFFYYRHYGTFLRNVKIPKKISKNDYCTLYLRRKKVWRDFRSYLLIIHSPGKGTRNRAKFPILFAPILPYLPF